MASIHVISKNDKVENPVLLLPLGDDRPFDREVWSFLVGNLKPGFTVRYYAQNDDDEQFQWDSGESLPADVYAELIVLHAFPRLPGRGTVTT